MIIFIKVSILILVVTKCEFYSLVLVPVPPKGFQFMSKSQEPEPSSLRLQTGVPTCQHQYMPQAIVPNFGAHLEFQACSTGFHPQIPHRHLLGLVSNRSGQLGVVEPHRTLHLVWELKRARNGHKETLTFWISSRYLQ